MARMVVRSTIGRTTAPRSRDIDGVPSSLHISRVRGHEAAVQAIWIVERTSNRRFRREGLVVRQGAGRGARWERVDRR